jgi:PAS domain S-box-containing protein
MNSDTATRAGEIFADSRDALHRQTSRMFLWLLLAQWVFAIGLAVVVSPYTWTGSARALHFHVKAAVLLGGLINALPIALIIKRPTWWGTRHVIAVVQMLWSAMLIMITGGRIETHFHVFGSLAFLAFYRDWRVVATATVVVVVDHLARGLWWPDSVYGIQNPEWWRFVEHAGWVVFEDIFLVWSCLRGVRELHVVADREAKLEHTKQAVERVVASRTRELRDAVERYRSLVEDTDAIPFEYDIAAHEVVYVAPRIAERLGLRPTQLRKALFTGLVHEADRARVAAALAAYGQEGRAGSTIDHRLMSASGEAIYVRTFLSHLADGRIRGILIDVTRQRQLENELQQAQRLESLGRLAAGVAHEINTPIQFLGDSVDFVNDAMQEVAGALAQHQRVTDAVIAGAPALELATAAAATTSDPEFQYDVEELPRALARAGEGVERVAKIVRSMNTFARSDLGTMELVDLNAAVENTLIVARSEYKYVADIDLQLGELPRVACHVGEINQALLNVVVNAAHAIADVVRGSERRGTITIATRVEDGFAAISVGDTGGGIAEHVRDRIFEPFFTTKVVGKGTGQGLAIARTAIVERHSGKLTFETELGRGTVFCLRIPISEPVKVAA